MSTFNFKLPDIGEGVMEGEIVTWLVKPGDTIQEDQPVVEVMTDKATVTITSPKEGKVVALGGPEGGVIPVHSTLLELELSASAAAPDAAASDTTGAAGAGPAATAVGDIKETLPGMGLMQRSAAARSSVAPAPATGYFRAKPLATPATRKLARELAVDLRQVPPSGPRERVIKADVRRFAEGTGAHPHGSSTGVVAASSAQPASARAALRPPIVVTAPDAASQQLEVRTPLKGIRKRVFEQMARSKHTAAHFTFVEECDVSQLKALRARLKPLASEKGVNLSFLPFFVKALVSALKKHPVLNSAFDESTQEIVERHYYNVGIATATDAGLMVPVVKNADKLSLLDIAREISRLAESTKSGRINADDLRGSTFTITSLGRQGGLFATPILNTPEVGILGIHQMKQKPVVRDGSIVIGDVMLLSLSFDHRLIDGHIGAAFAYDIIALLENPDLLWLEMA